MLFRAVIDQVVGWCDPHKTVVDIAVALACAGGGDGCFVGPVCPLVLMLGLLGLLLFQHQLIVSLVSLVVLDLTRFVVAGEFAAAILIHTLGNDDLFLTRIGQLGHADAAIGAIQTLIANGDVGAPHQIHIAGSTVRSIRVPRDGRRVGHGEGGVIVDKHTVAGVAADLAVVHVEGAG